MKKKIISLALALVMVLGETMLMSVKTSALSIDDASVFLKQQTASTCTLVSAAMALRRKALLMGDVNWASITEDSLKPVAWSNGLLHDFSYATADYTYTISYGDVDGYGNASDITGQDKINALNNLLAAHQEGIVIYARNGANGYTEKNHAVLLTSYVNNVFYVADPAGASTPGLITIDQALRVNVENVASYWYVSNVTANNVPAADSAATAQDPSAPAAAAPAVTALDDGVVSLSKTSYTYNGKIKNPTVNVTLNNNALTRDVDYTVSYASNRKSVGKHKIVITGIGGYSGTLTATYKISPKKTKITSVSGKKKSASIKYASLAGNVNYQVAYRKAGRVKWNYTYTKSAKKTVKNLSRSSRYQFKVRGYKNGAYGKYSSVRNVKVK